MTVTLPTDQKVAFRALALIAALSFSHGSLAGLVFSDDFSDGNADGWSFVGNNSGFWSVIGGELVSDAPTGYIGGGRGFAVIDGVTTPDAFTLEASVRVITDQNGSDYGHIGFGWGINTANVSQSNVLYARTHSNHITHFSPSSGESIFGPLALTNDVSYQLSLTVDRDARAMTTSISGGALAGVQSITYTDATFDALNAVTGGAVGLITWGDKLAYDNIRLSVPDTGSVPAPATLALLGLGLLGLRLRRGA